MSDDIDFYTLLDQMSFKEALEFLAHNLSEVTLKIGSRHFKSKILARKSTNQFFIYKFNFEPYLDQDVTCSFEISAEKYYFKTYLTAAAGELMLAVPDEIFKLQRRNDFRVSVPASISYTCEIIGINGSPAKLKADIRDLSLGGCQLVVKIIGTAFHDGDELFLRLKINSFDWDRISCTSQRVVSKNADAKYSIGVRFLETSAAFATDMQSLLVQLDRVHRGKSYE